MSYDSWKTRSPDDELFHRLPYADEPADVVIEVPCPACQGEGRDIRYGVVYEPGCGHPHMGEVDHGICDVCKGACVVEEEVQPRTLADLEQEDFDMLEAQASR